MTPEEKKDRESVCVCACFTFFICDTNTIIMLINK